MNSSFNNLANNLLTIFIGSLLLLIFPTFSLAEDITSISGQQDTKSNLSVTKCINTEAGNNIKFEIKPSISATVTGIPIAFSGLLKNENSFPVINGKVFIKIFRVSDINAQEGMKNPILVDQFLLMDEVKLPAQSNKLLTFDWNIPAYAMSGNYEAVAFFVTGIKFNPNLIPLNYSTGSKTSFSVTSEVGSNIEFDNSSVVLNDNNFLTTAKPVLLKKDDLIKAKVTLKNPTNQLQVVGLTWTISNWNRDIKSTDFSQRFETVTLEPNENKSFSFESGEISGELILLNVEAKWQDTKSLIDIYYTREGFNEEGFSLSGLTNYPLTKGEENTVFACIYSPALPTLQESELTMTLIDAVGHTIHSYTQNGIVVGSVMEIKDSFKPDKTINDFTLVSTLRSNGEVVEEIIQNYTCQEINPALCQLSLTSKKENSDYNFASQNSKFLIISLIILFLLFFTKKLKNIPMPATSKPSLFIAILISSSFLFSFSVNIAAAATAPNIPTIIPSSLNDYQVGSFQDFSLNTTDADGDTIRYGIDWDDNGSVDQWLPSFGYVNSGTAQSASRVWSNTGTDTFKVMAQDISGLNSGWRSYTVNIVSILPILIPANASISAAPICFISIGNSSCLSNIIWSSSNATNPSVRQNGIPFSTAVSSPFLGTSRVLTQGTHVFTFMNDSDILASVSVNAICFGGVWNGSICAIATSTAFASINAPDCTIVAGNSSCLASVSWNTSGIILPSIRQNGVPFSNVVFSSGTSRNMMFGANTFTVYDGLTQLSSDIATASCGSSSSWNGSICAGTLPAAPVLTLTASPTTITPLSSSTLTWTVTGAADSCWASGGWGGWKTYSGTDTEIVSPNVTTTYHLECYNAGVSSGVQSQTIIVNPVVVPSATISGTTCDIPVGGSSCTGTLTWNIQNATNPSVVNFDHAHTYSNNNVESNFPALFWYGVNTIYARNNTTNLSSTNPSPFVIGCVSGSSWNSALSICDNTLPQPPTLSPIVSINVEANPTLIRRGAASSIIIDINAAHPLNCVLLNAETAPRNFTHGGGSTSRTFTTRSLFTAQIVTVNCVSPLDSTVTGTGTARVNVVGILQEI